MHAYLGPLLLDRIENKKKYKAAVREVQHYLTANASDIEVDDNQWMITVRPRHNHDQFTIVKDCNYLQSSLYRQTLSWPPVQEELKFLQVGLECLMILKQYFPAKVDIQLETGHEQVRQRLDQILNGNRQELSRRYISALKLMEEKDQEPDRDDLDDLMYLLRMEQSAKLRQLCLTQLARVPARLYSALKQLDIELLGRLSQTEEHVKLASLILAKLSKAKQFTGNEHNSESAHRESGRFDEPGMLKSTLFQLRESNSLDRITFLMGRLAANLTHFGADALLKIDSALYETVAKQVEGKYGLNTPRQSTAYTNAVLRYVLERKSLRNLPQLIQLINNSAGSEPQDGQLKQTVEQFVSVFGGQCDEPHSQDLAKSLNRLAQLECSRNSNRSSHSHHRSTYQ